MVGLIRHLGWNPFHLTKDHQVLAFAYETAGPTGPTTIRLYDPNWPNRDDVSITLLQGGFLQSTGEPLYGLIPALDLVLRGLLSGSPERRHGRRNVGLHGTQPRASDLRPGRDP